MTIPSQRKPPAVERIDPRIAMFDKHLDAVYCHLWTRTGCNRELTEHLVAETFIAAVERFASLDRPELVWLCAIADELVIEAAVRRG